MNTVNERVERGAALLDEKRPGWLDTIDLGRLDIASPCNCVIGQFGDYADIVEALGLYYYDDEAAYGFESGSDDEFADLTDAWRDLIQQRRLARVPA